MIKKTLLIASFLFVSHAYCQDNDGLTSNERIIFHYIQNESLTDSIPLIDQYRSSDNNPFLSDMELLWSNRAFSQITDLAQSGQTEEADKLLSVISSFTTPIEIPKIVTETLTITKAINSGSVPAGVVFMGHPDQNTAADPSISENESPPPNNTETIPVETKPLLTTESPPELNQPQSSQSLYDLDAPIIEESNKTTPIPSLYKTKTEYFIKASQVTDRDLSILQDLEPTCRHIVKSDPNVYIYAPTLVDYRWIMVRLTLCVRRIKKGIIPSTIYKESQKPRIILIERV